MRLTRSLLIASLMLAVSDPRALHAEDPPATITSDTPEWCANMAATVAQRMESALRPPPRARVLAREGERMCRHGMIRPGIYRLRQAWILLIQPSAQPDPPP